MRKLLNNHFVVMSVLAMGIAIQSGPRAMAQGSSVANTTLATINSTKFTTDTSAMAFCVGQIANDLRHSAAIDRGNCQSTLLIANIISLGAPATSTVFVVAPLAGTTAGSMAILAATADALAANEQLDELRQVVTVAQPDAKAALGSEAAATPILEEAVVGIRSWANSYATDEFKHVVAQLSDQDLVVSIALSN